MLHRTFHRQLVALALFALGSGVCTAQTKEAKDAAQSAASAAKAKAEIKKGPTSSSLESLRKELKEKRDQWVANYEEQEKKWKDATEEERKKIKEKMEGLKKQFDAQQAAIHQQIRDQQRRQVKSGGK